MTLTIEFHFDFGSPNAYLSHLVINEMAAQAGATCTYVPVLLGGVFKATNNISPAAQGVENKSAYQQIEINRFLKKHGIRDFEFNPFFPINTLKIMRGAVFARRTDYYQAYIDALYHHMWAEPKKMDDPEVIAAALNESALPAKEILSGCEDPAIKASLIANTEQSVKRGTFGSPTFFVNQEIFFGKDKLPDVIEAIQQQK